MLANFLITECLASLASLRHQSQSDNDDNSWGVGVPSAGGIFAGKSVSSV